MTLICAKTRFSGMCILVDYFLTAAISCLSGILYLSVVIPVMGPFALEITIGTLVLLGLLNWIGISASAKVSLVGATIAFLSDSARARGAHGWPDQSAVKEPGSPSCPRQSKQPIPTRREQLPGTLGIRLMTREPLLRYALGR